MKIDDLRSAAGRLLYRELPEEYRFRDPPQGGPEEPGDLEAFLHGSGHLLDLVRATIEQAHADSFAEPIDVTLDPEAETRRFLSIQPWLIPYLAELLGADLVAPDPARRTEELGRAVGWTKSKGTLTTVDEVADVVAGTETQPREGWRLTLACPRVGLPPFTVPPVAMDGSDPLGATPMPLGTPDLSKIDRAVRDPSGASPLARLRFPLRDPVTGVLARTPETIYWRGKARGGAPAFPGHYDDGMPRCPDLRDPSSLRAPGPHPRRTLVHVRTPDGLFAAGLPVHAIAADVDLIAAARREEGWRVLGPNEALAAAGVTLPEGVRAARVVLDLAGPLAVPRQTRLRIEDVLIRGTVDVEIGGTLALDRAAVRTLAIQQPHDRRAQPSVEAQDSLLGEIISPDGWARLIHVTVMGD
ncbi:MAG: hypothetical protein AAFW69_10660, partial [Pseudomonadota bacterium]